MRADKVTGASVQLYIAMTIEEWCAFYFLIDGSATQNPWERDARYRILNQLGEVLSPYYSVEELEGKEEAWWESLFLD